MIQKRFDKKCVFFKVPGSVTSSTICLGDVDNDGEYELCVGSPTGQLSIFKGGLEPNMTKREVRIHPNILLIPNIYIYTSRIFRGYP